MKTAYWDSGLHWDARGNITGVNSETRTRAASRFHGKIQPDLPAGSAAGFLDHKVAATPAF